MSTEQPTSAEAPLPGTRGYLHGFTPREQDRLYHQARFMEHRVHDRLPFRRSRKLVEIGCGVGAQTEILLRRFPDVHVTGVDASRANLDRARAHLADIPWAGGRYEHTLQDATSLEFEADTFDGAFLCWVLEHVANPSRVLSEVRRVLRPGSPVVVTEVQNMSFFVDPYSPNTMSYWLAFNDPKRRHKKDSPKPDLHGTLPDGTRVDKIAGLKQVILDNHKDDVLRSVTKNMLIYAVGRPMDISDDAVIEEVMQQVTTKDYSTRELIRAVVFSKPFLEK